MPLFEQILSVARALWSNKLRSFLTLLGVIMGVATIVLLSSLVGGGLAAISRTVQTASGDDVLSVSVPKVGQGGQSPPSLTMADLRAIAEALGNNEVTPQLDERSDATAAGKTMRVRLVGTNEEAQSLYGLGVARGRFLTSVDRAERQSVVVVGSEVAKNLGLVPSDELRVEGTRFRVVGVLAAKPSLNVGNQPWNNAVAMPDATYMSWKGESALDAIVVKARSSQPLPQAVRQANHTIRSVLLNRRHPGWAVSIDDSQNKSGEERGFLAALQLLLYAVALICLGVGGINIMNIMLVSVTERTREIGLRRAIGARKKDIRNQFILEAAIISGMGGLLGIAFGLGLSWLISFTLTAVLGYWPYVLDPLALLIASASALATGVLFGWYPASRAASLEPIECLRYQ